MTDTLATKADLRDLEVRTNARFDTFEKRADARLDAFDAKFEARFDSLSTLCRRWSDSCRPVHWAHTFTALAYQREKA